MLLTGTKPALWQQDLIGAGGYITGLDIAKDGTRVVRCDTYGCYVHNASGWSCMTTSTSMPSGSFSNPFAPGVFEIAVAPSNSFVMYKIYNGFVYVSTNRGLTWVQTTFTQDTNINGSISGTGANGSNRTMGPRIAIDPQNPDVVVVGCSTGVFYSTNGTAGASSTFTQISSLATPGSVNSDSGCALIKFDPTSTVTGNITQGLYISVYGTGVYHGTGGPAGSFSLTTSTPTTHEQMDIDISGNIWLIDVSGGVHKFNGTTWATQTGPSGVFSIACDPASANNVYAALPGSGVLWYTRNGGTNWFESAAATVSVGSGDPGWQSNIADTFFSTGRLHFDPSQSNVLYLGWGFGVVFCTPPTTSSNGAALNWTTQVAGIEQTVVNWIISPWWPNSDPVVFTWDLCSFKLPAQNVYPSVQGTNNSSANLIGGWSGDWAAPSPNTVVVLANGEVSAGSGVEASGLSTNGGQSFTNFTTVPPGGSNDTTHGGLGGSIAAASATNFLLCRTDNGSHTNVPYYTTDGGTTWNTSTFSGSPIPSTTGPTGWLGNFYQPAQFVCADRVLSNTFYMFNAAASASGGGVWISTNSGQTFTRQFAGPPATIGFLTHIKAVPTQSGNLFWTGQAGLPNPTATGAFKRSTDQGVTWTTVTNVTGVLAFGFGAVAPGQTYPGVFLAGFVSSVQGIWYSADNCSTWTKLGTTYPMNIFCQINTVEGDANNVGMCHVGFAGSGAYRFGVPL